MKFVLQLTCLPYQLRWKHIHVKVARNNTLQLTFTSSSASQAKRKQYSLKLGSVTRNMKLNFSLPIKHDNQNTIMGLQNGTKSYFSYTFNNIQTYTWNTMNIYIMKQDLRSIHHPLKPWYFFPLHFIQKHKSLGE